MLICLSILKLIFIIIFITKSLILKIAKAISVVIHISIIRQMKYCDYSNSFMIMLCMILPFSVIIAKCLSFYFHNGFLIWLIIQTIFSCYMMFVLDDNASEYFSIFYRINILKKKKSFIGSLLILEILAWMICIYLFI